MKLSIKVLVLAILAITPLVAQNIISFEAYKNSEFSPARKQNFIIPFSLTQSALVDIDIYAPDGDKVRTLSSKKELKKGKHSFSWDGKDSEGIIVPNEAYSVVLKVKSNGKTISLDPRTYSGGEIDKSLGTQMSTDGKIIYNLAKPSRVLIRAGITDGPMMRSLINWVPKPAGKNIQHWNGYDADKVVNVFDTKRFGVIVVAFALAQHSIITTGNEKLSYPQYYKNKKWSFKPTAKDKRLIERDGKGISPHFYTFRITDKDPRINIKFPSKTKKNKDGIALLTNDKAIPVKVTMPVEDEKFIEQSKYEVSFFVDHEFKSEEELGFMPITWLWSPNGFKKGEHILTVNVSGFSGQVGVKNIKFIIE